jgi:hypothetical protein
MMVRLDSLGYTPSSKGVQMSLVVFDPNGFKHPMNSWDTTKGTFYKSWWGSEWGGTWKTVLLESLTGVDVERLSEVPTVFALFQNYPNPFNPSTRIRFHVPVQSRVSIVMFDMTGREVRTVVSGDFSPGAYEKALDARDLASGVYVYRMTTQPSAGDAFVAVRKLVLVK